MNISGNINNLNSKLIQRLKKLTEKRIKGNVIITNEISKQLCEISYEIRKQIGILVNRSGNIIQLMVGDDTSIEIPFLNRIRISHNRLRGLRLVHTHLKGESLNYEDLCDMVLLRLDYITAITLLEEKPHIYYSAHINPKSKSKTIWKILPKVYFGNLDVNFLDDIEQIETKYSKYTTTLKNIQTQDQAYLIGVYTEKSNLSKNQRNPKDSISELEELCKTANIESKGQFIQVKHKLNPTTVLGKGKIKEVLLKAIQENVELLIFDLELSSSQARNISKFCDLKVLDRTQLILDIFANHAKSKDGKLQVELAQLKYLKGRLTELDDNMSRLTGGIGGRGPGETKLEIGKRKIEDKITRLEKELKNLRKRRYLNRSKRKKSNIPIVGIVGYTNSGKSTLLNSLTHSSVLVENKVFATLDTTSRRIRFPKEKEIILSDTVGFIHNLPKDLMNAFKATLEELEEAHLLLHVIDYSNPNYLFHIESVDKILAELNLLDIKRLKLFNKIDIVQSIPSFFPRDEIFISANQKIGFKKLLFEIEKNI